MSFSGQQFVVVIYIIIYDSVFVNEMPKHAVLHTIYIDQILYFLPQKGCHYNLMIPLRRNRL
jgi:hypothetical protein